MDFLLSEEQKIFKATLERLNKREIEPLLAQYPEDVPLPKEVILKIAQTIKPLGLLGARIPIEDGGTGLDLVSVGLAYETIDSAALWATANDTIGLRICTGGDTELKKRVLPPLLEGQKLAGSAISEPDAGSDLQSIKTKAILVGDKYVVNGTKIWSSNGSIADILLATVSLGRDERGRNLLASLVIERDISPYQARDLDMLGLRHHHLSEVVFEDCQVPKGNLIGEPGSGSNVLQLSWLSQRPLLGLQSVNLAQRALDLSIEYAKQRKQFGKVIGSFQTIQNMIVEMATLVIASRLLCYQALSFVNHGVLCTKESSLAKYFATESAVKVTSMAIQVHGSYGLSRENKLERYFRDARMLCLPDGTTEIQKLIAGREILGISAFR